jgi:hypothetical protein
MADGTLRKQPPNLLPPGPKTNYRQDGCYLAFTKDCSKGISAEHYLSRSVLKELSGPTVGADGFFWQEPGERQELSINRLTSKILCARHNSALSGLDDEAALFLKRLKEIFTISGRHSLSTKRTSTIISGETLELWFLKLACGLFYSKIASSDRHQLYKDHLVDDNIIAQAMFSKRWYPHCGLYLRGHIGSKIGDNAISVAPATATNEKRYVGVHITIMGLELSVVFDPRGANPNQFGPEGWRFRPTDVIFRIGRRTNWMILTWPSDNERRAVDMRLR